MQRLLWLLPALVAGVANLFVSTGTVNGWTVLTVVLGVAGVIAGETVEIRCSRRLPSHKEGP